MTWRRIFALDGLAGVANVIAAIHQVGGARIRDDALAYIKAHPLQAAGAAAAALVLLS